MSFRDILTEARVVSMAALKVGLPIVLVIAAAMWITWRFVEPAPPHRVVMASGLSGGSYDRFAQEYAEYFRKNGFELVVKQTAGSVDNYKLLLDPNSGVDVAIIQGGTAPKGASEHLEALCSLFLEPCWVFYRGDTPVTRLSGLAGRRIAIGPDGSGVRALATRMMEANGIDVAKPGQTQFLDLTGKDAADALIAGQIDVAMFVTSPENETIRRLLTTPEVRLMSFTQADAYERRYRYLTKVMLYEGSADLGRDYPPADCELIAPTAVLVARKSIHHGTVELLIEAARASHSGSTLVSAAGVYPTAPKSILPASTDGAYYLRTPPIRFLASLPFWMKSLLDRLVLLLIPLLALLLPLMKIAPLVYRWSIRRRITRHYPRLKLVSAHLEGDADRSVLQEDLTMLEKVEHRLASMTIPGGFMPDLYDLGMHVERLKARLQKRLAERA